MDPTETLRRIRALVARQRELESACEPMSDDDVDALADAIEALDSWITNGGFLPDSWNPKGSGRPCNARHETAGLCELQAGHRVPHRVGLCSPGSAPFRWKSPAPSRPRAAAPPKGFT